MFKPRKGTTRKRKLNEIHILSLKVVCLILMKSIGYAADYYTQGVSQLFTCDLASCVWNLYMIYYGRVIRPDVTICCWPDVKRHEFTKFFFSFSFLFLFFGTVTPTFAGIYLSYYMSWWFLAAPGYSWVLSTTSSPLFIVSNGFLDKPVQILSR